MTSVHAVAQFEALRPHLMAVAYRLTGTVADAEDIVQEAWLRWNSQDTTITDLRAWLTTVVSRLGLDRLRSAAHRRETYTGNWLPEPVVSRFDEADPLSAVVAGEDARFAAMVVLERLSPDQRVAFVLHDGFAVPFAEVAAVLGTSEPAGGSWRRGPARPSPPDPRRGGIPATTRWSEMTVRDGKVCAIWDIANPDKFTGSALRATEPGTRHRS